LGAQIRRPHSSLLALLAVVLMSAGGLVAWAARPPRPSRRPPRRPAATRPVRPTPGPRPGVHPHRPRPVVRIVPRPTAVVLHDTEPETEEVVRDAGSLPPTALQTSDAEGDEENEGEGQSTVPQACPVTAVGDDLTLTVTVDGRATPVRLVGVAEAKVTGAEPPMTARAFLRNLLAGEFVHLVPDENLDATDEEGRRVAYVYRVPDGMLVNLELIRQGYAVTAQDYAFQHLDAFVIYQRRARADDRGLWALVDDAPATAPEAEQVTGETPAE
jgi:endonuclease YncB( thermonuclease family)